MNAHNIRCRACGRGHSTVAEVKDCYAGAAERKVAACSRHEMIGCIHCTWTPKPGVFRMNSKLTGTWCQACKEPIQGPEDATIELAHGAGVWLRKRTPDRIARRRGFGNWLHEGCFDNRWAFEEHDFRDQREPDPEYRGEYDRLSLLRQAGEDLMGEAIAVEQESTGELIELVEADMNSCGDSLDLDLLKETVYCLSPEWLQEKLEDEEALLEELARHTEFTVTDEALRELATWGAGWGA